MLALAKQDVCLSNEREIYLIIARYFYCMKRNLHLIPYMCSVRFDSMYELYNEWKFERERAREKKMGKKMG